MHDASGEARVRAGGAGGGRFAPVGDPSRVQVLERHDEVGCVELDLWLAHLARLLEQMDELGQLGCGKGGCGNGLWKEMRLWNVPARGGTSTPDRRSP